MSKYQIIYLNFYRIKDVQITNILGLGSGPQNIRRGLTSIIGSKICLMYGHR